MNGRASKTFLMAQIGKAQVFCTQACNGFRGEMKKLRVLPAGRIAASY